MVYSTTAFTRTANATREATGNDTRFQARPTSKKTDYAAFTKDVIKRFPKVIAELAK
ncbi:hypothetical protein PMI41_02113 [Phyllobacterium sp. YR531]|nr:hypothetical protein PMI41_02113 [Phyllobacterium sp. YR531]